MAHTALPLVLVGPRADLISAVREARLAIMISLQEGRPTTDLEARWTELANRCTWEELSQG